MTAKEDILRKRIKELAKERNMSINSVAINGEITPSTLQAFMTNKSHNPTVRIIEGVSDGLGISVREFFDFEPYNLNPKQKYEINEKTPEEILKKYNLSIEQLEDILKIINN